MCGLVGIFYKGEGAEGPVGDVLVPMCQDLYRRGPDSTGFAVYRLRVQNGTLVVRVDLDRPDLPNAAELTVIAAEQLVLVKEWKLTARSVRLEVDSDADGKLADWIEERIEGARVFSVGQAMEIIKDVGSANDVDRRYGVRQMSGSHGIGHTRMATESRVDIAHSHPFWARPFPDIAVVHNGTITNYHQLRRRLEMKGHRFATGQRLRGHRRVHGRPPPAGRVPGGRPAGLDQRPRRHVRLPHLHRPGHRPRPRPVRHQAAALRRERRARRARVRGDRHPHARSAIPSSCRRSSEAKEVRWWLR